MKELVGNTVKKVLISEGEHILAFITDMQLIILYLV